MIALFFASFFNVALLGLNSQFVRDQRIALVFFVSWNIQTSQFIYTRVVSGSQDPDLAFLAAGWGGSLGIAFSVVFYRWLNKRSFFIRFQEKSEGGFHLVIPVISTAAVLSLGYLAIRLGWF